MNNRERHIASPFAILLSFLMVAAPFASAQSTGKRSAPPDDEKYLNLRPRPNRATAKSQTNPQPEQDNANARHMWLTQRMAGLGGPEYIRHVLREADKQRALHSGAGNQ